MNRGDVFWEKWSFDGEQGGFRPVIVISDTTKNNFLPTVLVAPLVSKIPKKLLPTHIKIDKGQGGLQMDSLVIIERSQIIDKGRLINKIGSVNDDISDKVVNALLLLLGTKKYSKADSDTEKEYTAFEKNLMKEIIETKEIINKINNPTIISKIKNATLNGTIGTIVKIALGYIIVTSPLVFSYISKIYHSIMTNN